MERAHSRKNPQATQEPHSHYHLATDWRQFCCRNCRLNHISTWAYRCMHIHHIRHLCFRMACPRTACWCNNLTASHRGLPEWRFTWHFVPHGYRWGWFMIEGKDIECPWCPWCLECVTCGLPEWRVTWHFVPHGYMWGWFMIEGNDIECPWCTWCLECVTCGLPEWHIHLPLWVFRWM